MKAGLPLIPTQWSTARTTRYPSGFPSQAELAHIRNVFDDVLGHVRGNIQTGAKRPHFQISKYQDIKTPPRGTAVFQVTSHNRKLTPVDVTDVNPTGLYRIRIKPRAPFTCSTSVSIAATCPSSCAFKGSGCYAEQGYTRFAGVRMDRAAKGVTGDEVMREEAMAIRSAFRGRQVPQDGARGGRDLRLHVAGDISSRRGAELLGAAAEDWRARGGGSVWTFTHRWPTVHREAWGDAVSVLASVEHPDQFAAARRQGYAPAIVVDALTSKRATKVRGLTVIPCPAETKGTTCVECRLCLDRDLYKMKAAIAFATHGKGAQVANRKLLQIRTTRRSNGT